MGKQWKQCQTLFFWAPKSLQMVTTHPEVRQEGREPLPDHAGESTLLSRSGGEMGLSGRGAGILGVPLGGPRRVGGLLGVAGRLSGAVSPFRVPGEAAPLTELAVGAEEGSRGTQTAIIES